METFVIITGLLGFVQLLLHPFNINFIEKSMFDFFEYCNNNQLTYLFFSIGLSVAMIVYYRNNINSLCKDVLLTINKQKSEFKELKNFCIMVAPAIIFFGALSVLRFYKITLQLPAFGIMPHIVIPNLIAITVAVAIFFCDRKSDSEKKMTKKDATIIGFTQLLSIIPGISRIDISFITMRCLGFSRIDSFRNFILLSLPLQIGSCIFQAINIGNGAFRLEILRPLIGGAVIFVVSLALLHFINWFLKKFTLSAWAIYRIFMSSMAIIYFLIYVYPELGNIVPAAEPVTEMNKPEEIP